MLLLLKRNDGGTHFKKKRCTNEERERVERGYVAVVKEIMRERGK